jgi:hypothetical protein
VNRGAVNRVIVSRAFSDYETAVLRRMTTEQKLRTLDAIRRSAALAKEIGHRLRQSASSPARTPADTERATWHERP